jgi:YebC/PmpR family DNA-binding regulatory protein
MKGTGELGAENYESIQYEGYGPNGVAIMVDGLTNNRARTAPELRKIFEVNGGNLATSGSVAFQFTKQGVITIRSNAVVEDTLLEVALDAGAEDVKNEGEVFEVITSPVQFLKVRDAIAAAKIPVEASEVTFLPNTTIPVEGEAAQRILRLIDALEDNDDVQSVSHNADIPESVGA